MTTHPRPCTAGYDVLQLPGHVFLQFGIPLQLQLLGHVMYTVPDDVIPYHSPAGSWFLNYFSCEQLLSVWSSAEQFLVTVNQEVIVLVISSAELYVVEVNQAVLLVAMVTTLQIFVSSLQE